MKSAFRAGSRVLAYLSIMEPIGVPGVGVMGEVFRSGAIVLMGLVVIGAGIFVVFHHLTIG